MIASIEYGPLLIPKSAMPTKLQFTNGQLIKKTYSAQQPSHSHSYASDAHAIV